MLRFSTSTLAGLFVAIVASSQTYIEAATVSVFANSFSPSSVQINVGDSVTWVNEDEEDIHAIASNTGEWSPAGYLLEYGQTFQHTFNAAGTYGYHDAIHGFNGTVTVLGTPANEAPTVAFTSPTNNQVFFSTNVIAFAASAFDSDGSIASVQFRFNDTLLTNDSSAPYTFLYTNAPAGTNLLSAISTDNLGLRATNTVTALVNSAPTVSLTSPANNTKLVAPATFTLVATTADSDGSVTNVQFYLGAGTTLLGNDSTSPYTLPLANVPPGTYTYYAVASDNRGESKLSAQGITVTVITNTTLSLPTMQTNRFEFQFGAVVGHSYRVEASTNLSTPNGWFILDTFIAQSNLVRFTDLAITGTNRPYKFYRVRSN